MSNSSEHRIKKLIYEDLSHKILNSAFYVHNQLGIGFLEKVYENAFCIVLKKKDLKYIQQVPIKVHFEGQLIGEYFADIVVENKVIIELKTVDEISNQYRAQLMNYLKASGFKLGLLINFAKLKLQWERIVM